MEAYQDQETQDFLLSQFHDEEYFSNVTKGGMPDTIVESGYGLKGIEGNGTLEVPDLLLNTDEVPSFTVKEYDYNSFVGKPSAEDFCAYSSSDNNSYATTTDPDNNSYATTTDLEPNNITVSTTATNIGDDKKRSVTKKKNKKRSDDLKDGTRDSGTDTDQEKMKKDRLRASVAKASRKIRLKRKLEKENLLERNQELEIEQEGFMRQIGELQFQINSLKACPHTFVGKVNLKTENVLLRAQVKRHKTFVNRLKCILKEGNDIVTTLTRSEKIKVANNGIESGVGQLLGMCYTSVMDSTWKRLEYKPNHARFTGVKTVIRYQFLPIGSTPETATRVNIRRDLWNVPSRIVATAKEAQIGCMNKKKMYLKAISKEFQKDPELKVNKIEMEELDLGFGNLSINKNTDETKTTEDDEEEPELIAPFRLKRLCVNGVESRIMFETHINRTLNPQGFPEIAPFRSKGAGTEKPHEATVFVRSEAPTSLIDPSCDVRGDNIGEIDGFIFHEMEPGVKRSCFTRVTSRSLDPQTPFLRLTHSKLIQIMKDTSLNEEEKMFALIRFHTKIQGKFMKSLFGHNFLNMKERFDNLFAGEMLKNMKDN